MIQEARPREVRSMIDVTQAVRTAKEYVAGLFSSENISDIRLEGVELSDDEKFWHVTVGFLRAKELSGGLVSALHRERDYKQVKINAETGEVRALNMVRV
jgi:hypothetical protein